jgi:hypothetical protein
MITKVLDWLGFGSQERAEGEHDHELVMVTPTVLSILASRRRTAAFGQSNGSPCNVPFGTALFAPR